MGSLTHTLLTFGVLMVVFLPLERLFPAHRQRVIRREWGTDVLFFLGQFLVWTTPVVAVLTFVYFNAKSVLPLEGLQEAVRSLPYWGQFLLAIGLCDMAIYWGHRLSHTNKFLWRFHRVHHTSERLDWVAAYREHPFDNLYTRLIENLPLILLGFPLYTIAGFMVFRGIWAVYIHSNVALDPGPLRYILGSPRLHHRHHDYEGGGRVNFANVSPLMDLLFGTYDDPGKMPERYGISDDVSHNYVRQLVDPLLPGRPRATNVVSGRSTTGEATRIAEGPQVAPR